MADSPKGQTPSLFKDEAPLSSSLRCPKMNILFGVCTDENKCLRAADKNSGTGLVGIMKLVFQDLPVEDGVRLLTPRRNRTDS